jgi:MtN3 and saliva related transmembrane protein
VIGDPLSWIGIGAALLTSLSYLPQVRKAWPRGATKDLSLHMLIVLTGGLALWIVYGVLKSDWVIAAANGVGATLSGTVLILKLRDLSTPGRPAARNRNGSAKLDDHSPQSSAASS